MSTTQLEGIVFTDRFHGPSPKIILWQEGSIDPKAKRATLLIHDGKPQTLFTEEEHEAEFQRRAAGMLRELDDACGFAPIHFEIAERHGITL
jgi:hypothetical protein